MDNISKEIFDKIYEPNLSSKDINKAEKIFNKDIFGTIEVIARDDRYIGPDGKGKIIHHEEPNSNMVLTWAKHCIMKLMAGDIMAKFGSNRMDPSLNDINFGKGTFISNKQYFSSATGTYTDTSYNYNASYFTGFANMKNPYFPTKMLFGTGKSIDGISYPCVNDDNNTQKSDITNPNETLDLTTEGWVQSIHSTGGIVSPDIYGISSTISPLWENFTNNMYSTNINNWLPAFVYLRRSRPFETSSEMSISKYNNIYPEYNQISYTTTLPSQIDGKWYPYNFEQGGNAVMIKYAGLFCDAGWIDYSGNNENFTNSGSPGSEFQNGILWAKRAISPVSKSENISIEFIWNIFSPR